MTSVVSSPAPSPFEQPRAPIPFDEMHAEAIEPAFARLIARAQRDLEALTSGPATYEATLGALDRATRELDYAFYVIEHLDEVLGTPEHRRAYEAVARARDVFYGAMARSESLLGALRRLAGSEEGRSLEPVRARFLARMLADLEREGATLAADAKARLAEIDGALAERTLRFVKNADDAVSTFAIVMPDASRLAGLPQSALAAGEASARAHGHAGYRFTLQAPSLTSVLKFAEDRALRREIYLAAVTAASGQGPGGPAGDNRPLIREILALRAERAALLGFADFTDYITRDRMMKSGKRALAFVETLMLALEGSFHRETEELVAFARAAGHEGALEAWDVAFWAEKQRRAVCDVDSEALRPYFPVDRVLDGVFELAHALYQLRIVPAVDAPTWHPDVTVWEAHGPRGLIGIFYLDLFTRASKREGAWMTPVFDRIPAEDDLPSLVIVATDIAPSPQEGRPALLSHDEVIRLFHEVGHLFHHMLSEVPIRRLSGTRVSWDFVELPSTLMESFAWEPEVLDRIGRHVDTGAPIPRPLQERMVSARRFRAVSALVSDLGLAAVDLRLHAGHAGAGDGDVTGRAREVFARFSPTSLPAEYAKVCTFAHIFGSTRGYEAGFYAYTWADLLAANAFERFRAAGLLSATEGEAFRREVLSRGDAEEAATLFRAFVGRDPHLDGLLTRLGVDPSFPRGCRPGA
jgi:oligopeptidase A